MSVPKFKTNSSQTFRWPTRRLAQWGATNSINSITDAQNWLTANVTTIAQCRTVMLELLIALVQMANDGD